MNKRQKKKIQKKNNLYPEVGTLQRAIWAMEPKRLEGLIIEMSQLEANALRIDKQIEDIEEIDLDYEVVNGVAQIPIVGPIFKETPWIYQLFGIQTASTVEIKAQLEDAIQNKDVKSIMLNISSPGGTLSGVQELAEYILSKRDVKSIDSNIDDLAASAAYWLASQTNSISANKTAEVGSIGVYEVLVDYSGMNEKEGINVHVVRSGDLKGVGAGDKITDKQLKKEQSLIDQAAEMFIDAVAQGRGMDRADVAKLATGEVWFAKDAKKNGLIDSVRSLTASKSTDAQTNERDQDMDEKKVQVPVENDAGKDLDEALKLASEAEKRANEAEAKIKEEMEKQAKILEDMKALRVETCEQVIDRAIQAGKVPPAQVDAVKEYMVAIDYDYKKLENFVNAFDVQTHADIDADIPSEDNKEIKKDGLSDIDKQVLAMNPELSAEDLKTFEGVEALTWDGRRLDINGEVIQ